MKKMDALFIASVLIVCLVIVMIVAMIKENRNMAIGAVIMIMILSIIKIAIEWPFIAKRLSFAISDCIMIFLCIAILLYYWKIKKG